jgi:hypothetical protein
MSDPSHFRQSFYETNRSLLQIIKKSKNDTGYNSRKKHENEKSSILSFFRSKREELKDRY